MRRLNLFILSLFILMIPFVVKAEDKEPANIYVFYGDGCQYCAGFMSWYNSLDDETTDKFNLIKYEVWSNENNSTSLTTVAEYFEEDEYGIPFIIIGDTHYNGFLESSMADTVLETMNTYYDEEDRVDVIQELIDNGTITVEADITPAKQSLKTAVIIIVVLIVAVGGVFLIYVASKED